MERAKLYSGTRNASSWAMRAWLALRQAGIDFEEQIVDIRRPQRFPNLARIGDFSPLAAVPVLTLGNAVVFDSLAIMEFANDASGGRLLPEDPVKRAQARSVLAWQHSGLSGICTRISFESAFYPYKRTLSEDEVAECDRLFPWLERLLEENGGPFLFGGLSLADLSLVPTMVRLTRHDLPLDRFPRCDTWTNSLLDLADVRAWLDEADRLPHIWFDNYLGPGMQVETGDSSQPSQPPD
jgi:glutathione S-transferase